MHGAAYALIANVVIAALFAGTFAAIALTNPGQRAALWFCASYATGMLTPLSELFLPFSKWPGPFMLLSHASFCGGILLMAAALAVFYKARPRWSLLAVIFLGAVAARLFSWDLPRDSLTFNAAYQIPFAIAATVCAVTIYRAGPRRRLELCLVVLFGLFAAHFLAKPFVAQAVGAGSTASDYIKSSYALFSQARSGALLIAIGLLTLLIVAQAAIRDARHEAMTDVLSGLPNRRGFDLSANHLIATLRRDGQPAVAMQIDIDHFKHINDTYGHADGDAVIIALADSLRSLLPPDAIVGRVGGEEFAVFFAGAGLETGRTSAERLRAHVMQSAAADLPAYTISVGVSVWLQSDSLSDVMRRADAALYAAKRQGRNQVALAEITFAAVGQTTETQGTSAESRAV